jgi:hypothetical protein
VRATGPLHPVNVGRVAGPGPVRGSREVDFRVGPHGPRCSSGIPGA